MQFPSATAQLYTFHPLHLGRVISSTLNSGGRRTFKGQGAKRGQMITFYLLERYFTGQHISFCPLKDFLRDILSHLVILKHILKGLLNTGRALLLHFFVYLSFLHQVTKETQPAALNLHSWWGWMNTLTEVFSILFSNDAYFYTLRHHLKILNCVT